MSITTVRPASQELNPGGNWKNQINGTGNLNLVLDDADPGDNTTWVQGYAAHPTGLLRLDWGDIGAVSGSQRIKQARIRYIFSSATGTNRGVDLALFSPDIQKYLPSWSPDTSSTAWKSGASQYYPLAPGNREWTKTIVDALRIRLSSNLAASARVAELWLDVDIRDLGTLSAPTVTGDTSTTRPTGSWSWTPNADSDGQVAWQAKVFRDDIYGLGTFDPATSPAEWDSGVVRGEDTQATVGLDLVNGETYKFYVRAAQDFNGADWYVGWQGSSAFTITLSGPNAPALTVTSDNTAPRLRNLLKVIAGVNVLSADRASFEAGLDGWIAVTNCSVAQSATTAKHGTKSLAMTSTASGDMTARPPSGLSAYPARPGSTWVGLGSCRANSLTRQVRVTLLFYDRGGTQIQVSNGGLVTNSSSDWTTGVVSVSATAPAGTGFVQLRADVLATAAGGEVHRWDCMSLAPGTSTAWTPGGFGSDASVNVEFADLTGGDRNWVHGQISSGGAFTRDSAGFFARTNDRVTFDLSDQWSGEGCILWEPQVGAFGALDIGLPNVVTADYAPLYLTPAVPGLVMTASLYARASTSFSSKLFLFPTDEHNNIIGPGANNGGMTIPASWTRYQVSMTIPAGASYCRLALENTASATELQVRVDGIQVEPGSTAGTLQPGQGLFPTWAPIRNGVFAPSTAGDQTTYVFDEEAPPARVRAYRAWTFVNQSGGLGSIYGPAVTTRLATPTVDVLKDPVSPENAMMVTVTARGEKRQRDIGEFHGSGRPRAVQFVDFAGGNDGTITITTFDDDEFYRAVQLLNQTAALLWQHAEGGQTYIGLKEPSWVLRATSTGVVREITADYIETDSPIS